MSGIIERVLGLVRDYAGPVARWLIGWIARRRARRQGRQDAKAEQQEATDAAETRAAEARRDVDGMSAGAVHDELRGDWSRD